MLWTMHDSSLRSHYCPVVLVHTKGRRDGPLLLVIPSSDDGHALDNRRRST